MKQVIIYEIERRCKDGRIETTYITGRGNALSLAVSKAFPYARDLESVLVHKNIVDIVGFSDDLPEDSFNIRNAEGIVAALRSGAITADAMQFTEEGLCARVETIVIFDGSEAMT